MVELSRPARGLQRSEKNRPDLGRNQPPPAPSLGQWMQPVRRSTVLDRLAEAHVQSVGRSLRKPGDLPAPAGNAELLPEEYACALAKDGELAPRPSTDHSRRPLR